MDQCPYCKCTVVDNPNKINGIEPAGIQAGCVFCRGEFPEDHDLDPLQEAPPDQISLASRQCRHYCGYQKCGTTWLNIGRFTQGSGFTLTEAKEIVHRYNAYNDLVAAAEAALPTMSISNPHEAELLAKAVCRANGWQYGTVKDTVELLYEANRLRAKNTEVQG